MVKNGGGGGRVDRGLEWGMGVVSGLGQRAVIAGVCGYGVGIGSSSKSVMDAPRSGSTFVHSMLWGGARLQGDPQKCWCVHFLHAAAVCQEMEVCHW